MRENEDTTKDSSISPERFAQVRAVFEAALERPSADRRGYIDGACGADAELRREVEQMVAVEGKIDGLLDAKPSSAPEEGRFPAGTVLAERYRILGMLGRGGMGDVYKAFDLILNQTVALKFLTPTRVSEAAVVRFRNEVRIARQVSHPNVCRVYDLGMVEGLHFLSMEYIDGEDLASLLRRIGRLPQDKGVEFTRKICAGLSAAHERGVLHRDLKPANIMIDGRGQVRITDFGLAALAAEIPLSDLRSGTPAYMSPEQKAGRQVTISSDIYSLGLVIHEMFTGKQRANAQSTPSEMVKELDPAIERLIFRCLEEDPKRRPTSALKVAMALPGANPIAAALAAGETPSPEMVAASTEREGFSVRTAVICFALLAVVWIAGLLFGENHSFLARAPLPLPPDALADRAQQLLKTLGYTETPADTASGFSCCDQRVEEDVQQYEPGRRAEVVASHRPPAIAFWYRQHIKPFIPGDDYNRRYRRPTETLPPNFEAGMILVKLDALGRLLRLQVQPWNSARSNPIDWAVLFSAAGLDPGRFATVSAERIPPMVADQRLAWRGSYADDRKELVRVDAAAWHGQPVLFDVEGLPDPVPRRTSVLQTIFTIVQISISLSVLFMAWRNWRSERIDRRGARLLFFMSLVLIVAGGRGLYSIPVALSIWLYYIAIEPNARRYWPDSVISWTRLCYSRVRDPLVASHLLAGILGGQIFALLIAPSLELLTHVPWTNTEGLNESIGSIPFYLADLGTEPTTPLRFLAYIVVFRLVIRKLWVADLIAVLLFWLFVVRDVSGGIGNILIVSLVYLAVGFAWMWVIRHLGFLSLLAGFLSQYPLLAIPLKATGWMAPRVISLHLIPVAIATYALWTVVSARNPLSTDSGA